MTLWLLCNITLLFLAIEKGNIEIVKLLLSNKNIDLGRITISDLFSLIIINKAFEIAASKRFDFIINSLIENRMLNSDNAIQISIAQNNATLLKSLLQKINECINMNKFIEFVLSSNQNIQNIYYSYAQISDYTKKLLKNENYFYFDASNVNHLLQLAK